MGHAEGSYGSLVIIILLAAFIPFVISKIKFIRIPVVVGEIIAGMIIGKSGLNLIESSSWLSFLSTFGFAFLMFLSGLEIDFEMITKNKRKNNAWFKQPLVLGSVIFLLTLIGACLFAVLLKWLGWIQSVSLMTLILSTTSLGIVVPILKEKELLTNSYGQTILFAALIADFVTMFLITFYVTFYTSGLTYKVLLVLLLFVAFFIFYRMGVRLVKSKILEELAHTTTQIEIRGAFALILIFIALAQQLGSEIILGAFLAGLIFSLLKDRNSSQLTSKLDAIGYGFFIPIFFIMVGVNFNLQVITSNPEAVYLIPILIIGVYLVKIIPALVLKVSYSWTETLGAGILLSSRLSLIIAASAIGMKLGIISMETNAAVILVAIFSCTVSPLLFNAFVKKTTHKEQPAIFLIGLNERIFLLSQKLIKSGKAVKMATDSEERYHKAVQLKHAVYLGDMTNAAWLQEIGVDTAQTIVISTSNESKNAKIGDICSRIFNKDHIIVVANGTSVESQRNKVFTISPEIACVYMAENMITHPKTFELINSDNDNLDFKEVSLSNPFYFNKSLKQVKLPGDCLVLSILRNGEKIIPHGENMLKANDILLLVGSIEYTQVAQYMLTK